MNQSILIATCCLLTAYTVYAIIRRRANRLRPGRQAGCGAIAAAMVQSSAGGNLPGGSRGEAAPVIHPLLQRLANEWPHIFDAIVDPVFIIDSSQRIVAGNQAAALQLRPVDGPPLEEQPCYRLLADREQHCPGCPGQTRPLEKKPHHQEISHRDPRRTFSVSCSPLFEGERVVGCVSSLKDISHQRNLERRLLHAHKLESIATLAGGIAHDFNNILGAILGNADLLIYRLQEEKKRKTLYGPALTLGEIIEHLRSIKRAGVRAKDLVGQILAFSRQADNQRINLSIAPVVKESCRLLRATLPTTIELKVAVPEEIGMIHADPAQIQQVMMHVCTNAAQSLANETGRIEIALREARIDKTEQLRYHDLAPGRYVALTVADTGRGMSPETLERIFDPFFTTREVGQGSGMGLAVLHGIIMAHEGAIDVASAVGRGTVFTVYFPRVPDGKDNEDQQENGIPRGTGTILFVDDEEDILTMRARMLSLLGYRVLPAADPEQALDMLGKERIDLLITDQTMPKMTGLQLAARAHALRPDLPVILCSGYSEALTMEKAQQDTVCRFLPKSADMRLLALTVRETLLNRNEREL